MRKAMVAGIAAAAAVAVGCGGEQVRTAAAPVAQQSQVAFSFGGRIHLMRPDGSGRVRLTGGRFGSDGDGDVMPAWSPDARSLAFVRTVYHRRSGDGDSHVYLLGIDGGPARRLAVSGDLLWPAWAPDGTRLAFVRAVESEQQDEIQIVVAGLHGEGEQVLYRERPPEGKIMWVSEPAWSPDGSQIAFTRTTVDKRSYFRPDLYVMRADGGGVHKIADDAAAASWSPDGRRIAFASIRDRNGVTCGEDQCSYRGELYAMNADGTSPVRLTRNRGDDRSPSWSPDGTRIVFASDRNNPGFGGTELYSIGADGSCLSWLTNGSPPSQDPD